MILLLILISGLIKAQDNIEWSKAEFVEDKMNLNSKMEQDSIYYHSWYQDNMAVQFHLYQQDPWTLVRFSPTSQHISEGWQFAKPGGVINHFPSVISPLPGTVGVWNGDITPANLKLLMAVWEPDAGRSHEVIIDNGKNFTLTGDFWIGFRGINYPGGDSMMPARDITSPAAANRNYYSLNGMYGARILYVDYDFILTAYIQKPAIIEEGFFQDAMYLIPEANPILRNNEIAFSYRIPEQAFLKLYGIDGKLKKSKLLNSGERKVILNDKLAIGIYFYKLSVKKRIFSGKLLIL